MWASTENAPVYNVIQQQIQMTPKNFESTKSAPQMMEGNQQSNNSNLPIPTMNEEANSFKIQCQLNTIFLQKCFVNVQLKILMQRTFKAAEIFLQRVVQMIANLSSHVKIFKKSLSCQKSHNVKFHFLLLYV